MTLRPSLLPDSPVCVIFTVRGRFIVFHPVSEELFLAGITAQGPLSKLRAFLWASVSTSASQVRNLTSLPGDPSGRGTVLKTGKIFQPVLLMLSVALGPQCPLGCWYLYEEWWVRGQPCRRARGSGNSSALCSGGLET